MDNLMWMICGILFMAGVVVLGVGLVMKYVLSGAQNYQEKVQGTVVEIVEKEVISEAGVKRLYLHPVVTYIARGKRCRVATKRGYNPCPFRVNQEVTVRYHRKDPKDFEFAEDIKINRTGDYIYIGGILLCALSILIFIILQATA